MKKNWMTLFVTAFLILVTVGTALAANANPGVIPNNGPKYGQLGASWWQWAFSFPAADVPFFNAGGPVDISAGQSGNVWFLAGSTFGAGSITRSGTVPTGTSLFFPLVNLVNDYPCPPEYEFEPPPGETLEHFLQRTGNEFLDYYVPDPSNLFAEVDGTSLSYLTDYRATSSLFTFTADPTLAGGFDPCITGTPQSGVAVGYWILLPPLTPGMHTVNFGYTDQQVDVTYELMVTPGH